MAEKRLVRHRYPASIYHRKPCSVVAVGTALGIEREADIRFPEGLKGTYLSLDNMNRYVRSNLKVSRRVVFRRDERPLLVDFLRENTQKAVICVLGHYLYAEGSTYWSFFRNGQDPVVSVWYLSEEVS